jgi:hypothetical protein
MKVSKARIQVSALLAVVLVIAVVTACERDLTAPDTAAQLTPQRGLAEGPSPSRQDATGRVTSDKAVARQGAKLKTPGSVTATYDDGTGTENEFTQSRLRRQTEMPMTWSFQSEQMAESTGSTSIRTLIASSECN